MNPGTLTPKDMGTVLGMSLLEGRDIEALHETEVSLISGAGIPQSEYVIERFVLSACAAAHAAGAYLDASDRKLTAAGFMEWFQNGASSYAAFRAAYDTFLKRLPIYSAAANQDQAAGTQSTAAITFSGLSLAFGDALFAKARQAADAEGLCRVLASAVADAQWSAQIESSLQLFKRAGFKRDA